MKRGEFVSWDEACKEIRDCTGKCMNKIGLRCKYGAQ